MDGQRGTMLRAIESLVAERYLHGGEVRCSLVRSYTNEVYHAVSDDRQVIVKVYGAGWRSDGELRRLPGFSAEQVDARVARWFVRLRSLAARGRS
jgi:hypothetical protein